ncbi:DUF2341 domain-containing protein [uncultured Methanomethylovorans sp.]|uniref:DUF2341 domain-containing protein n=1 Tax=uncultured Methanomethylovorans sp. TaxID=183759 RepID=UPI002AA8021E|nr:DUF2341 domain-containing protein [uncultured Methanomethylovorans sp.]
MIARSLVKLSYLFAVLLLMTGFASALTGTGGGEWNYSSTLYVQENSGKDLTGYQVNILLDSSNFNFSEADPQGEDIRFEAGGKQLSYWIQSWDKTAATASVWVKMPSLKANGQSEVKIYYGNPLAEDVSDGASTFELFDDFSDSRLNYGTWQSDTNGGGQVGFSSDVCNLIVPVKHPNGYSVIKSKEDFPINSSLVVKRKKVTTGVDTRGPVLQQGFVDPQSDTKNWIIFKTEQNGETYATWGIKNNKANLKYEPWDLSDVNSQDNVWYISEIAWYQQGDEINKVSWFKNGVKDTKMDVVSSEETPYVPGTNMKVFLKSNTYVDGSPNTGSMSIDYVFVRNYTSQEPTVSFSTMQTEEQPVENVKETEIPELVLPEGKVLSVRYFDVEDYDDAILSQFNNSGVNMVFLRTTEDTIWKCERFIKTAHANNIKVYAMLFIPEGTNVTSGKDQLISTVSAILDYNTKSLSDFDGIDITLDPCTEDTEQACQDNMLFLEEVRQKTTDKIPLAVDVPASYDMAELANVSGNVDLFVLMTYGAEDQLSSIDPIADSLAPKMGEVRGADGKAMIDVMVPHLPSENATTSEFIGSVYDYYTNDPAFTGVVITLKDDYSQMVPAPGNTSTQEESQTKETPGFGLVSVVLGFVFVYQLKKEKR